MLPQNEHIGDAFREAQRLYPPRAIRELVANALIHQDMTISGAGPQIELFSERLEITNPGAPLMAIDRMIDLPPRSRNEALYVPILKRGYMPQRFNPISENPNCRSQTIRK